MYAVFKTGGKQYKASSGDILRVEKLVADEGSKLELSEVLMVTDGDKTTVGTPLVKGGKVTVEIVKHGRAKKVRIVKFRRRKHSRSQQGHRQSYTDIKVTDISQ